VGVKANTIEQVDSAGNGHKVLYQTAQWVDRPKYSPDGGRIAFQKGPIEGNLDVFVKNLSTGTVKQITSSSAFDGAPTWSPDGSRIAFVSTRSGPGQIWTVAATGGAATRITHTSTDEGSPAWTH
jgi:TolB protein